MPRRLSEIWIYPVKSLGGIRVKSSRVLGKGLEFDRRYMLVDASGTAITQRQYPKMSLFKTLIERGNIVIRYMGDHLSIPLAPVSDRAAFQVKIFDDEVMVQEPDSEYSAWFTEKLGVPCKLVYFPENHSRAVEPAHQINGEHVSLADAYPLLIIGQSSLDDLNSRLQEPIPMNRFRPNLVFEGGDPFEEDGWKLFKVGKNEFAGVKPCARCAIPTINQDNAQKGTEPTRTLASYRTKNNKVLFGQNVIVIAADTISEGDVIQLKSQT